MMIKSNRKGIARACQNNNCSQINDKGHNDDNEQPQGMAPTNKLFPLHLIIIILSTRLHVNKGRSLLTDCVIGRTFSGTIAFL
jgi:hypothetical protein